MINQAIILAGGLGTRLREVLPDQPKCMAPVNGKPFLAFVLDNLIKQNISEVILSVGFRKAQIINYFGNSYHSLQIKYSAENEPLGTGGAIKAAFQLCTDQDVFVVNGDTLFTPDLSAMQQVHATGFAAATIAVKFMADASRYGRVLFNHQGEITAFTEKSATAIAGWINGGVYLLNRNLLETQKDYTFSLEKDVFEKMHPKFKMLAFKNDAFFLDIGIPEDLVKAQTLLQGL